MLNRAYIASIEADEKSYRVRIPEYHKLNGTIGSVPDDELPIARVCTLPGVVPHYHIGDVVFVGFENSDRGYPVILGLLLTSSGNSTNQDVSVQCSSLEVFDQSTLSDNTTIGEVPPKNLTYLKNIPSIVDNISSQIHLMEQIATGTTTELTWFPIKQKYFTEKYDATTKQPILRDVIINRNGAKIYTDATIIWDTDHKNILKVTVETKSGDKILYVYDI